MEMMNVMYELATTKSALEIAETTIRSDHIRGLCLGYDRNGCAKELRGVYAEHRPCPEPQIYEGLRDPSGPAELLRRISE